ncbi:hypothetical protein CC2G_001147 [Coprinopsis cinerea AmutBmut pab1-1]|nr:hypothetical protein CC2G_001147 [Coprinopsis cinerea AmutBmut pab1-1]
MPKPIGPIDEHFLDKETLKNTCIKLTDVWMTQGEGDKAETVGLDDITYILPPDTRNPSHTKMVNAHKTDIYGIMTIDNLKQLSDEGLAEVKRLHQKEGLLLRIPFRLVICFKNNMQANFTTIRERGTDRSSLTIRSRNYLQYEILSIQSATYERCRNFMDRTQLYEMMKRLKEDHNQPLEDCTVEWYIAKYKEIIRPADKHRRLICDKDDTDHTLKDGTSKRPRFLRHLASSDLKARFAAQAEWILANQIATASKETDVVNLKKWTQFCKKVQKARERAASEGVRWGIPAGYDLEELRFSADNPFGMERFGSHRTYWKKKLHNALKRVSSQRKAGQKKVRNVRFVGLDKLADTGHRRCLLHRLQKRLMWMSSWGTLRSK